MSLSSGSVASTRDSLATPAHWSTSKLVAPASKATKSQLGCYGTTTAACPKGKEMRWLVLEQFRAHSLVTDSRLATTALEPGVLLFISGVATVHGQRPT